MVMLTGNSKTTAEAATRRLGIGTASWPALSSSASRSPLVRFLPDWLLDSVRRGTAARFSQVTSSGFVEPVYRRVHLLHESQEDRSQPESSLA